MRETREKPSKRNPHMWAVKYVHLQDVEATRAESTRSGFDENLFEIFPQPLKVRCDARFPRCGVRGFSVIPSVWDPFIIHIIHSPYYEYDIHIQRIHDCLILTSKANTMKQTEEQ